MAFSEGYREFVVEQLEHCATITSRPMFGGLGIYADGVYFALVDDDRLYFKVDDENRPEYEAAGMGPFRPYGDERTMGYYEVPIDVLEDPDRLCVWLRGAVEVAERAKRRRRKRS